MRLPNDVVIPEKPVRLEQVESWFLCPRCRTKLLKIKPNAKANGIIVKCKRCKKEIELSL